MRELGPQVYVQQSYRMRGIGLWLVERRAYDGAPVTSVGQSTDVVFEDLPEGAAGPETPTWNLRDDMALALLDALAAHYGGHSDVRSLRKDYDAERARVDKLTEAMIRTVASR